MWLLLFLKYDFTIIYKLNKTHVVGDVLFKLPNTTKPTFRIDHGCQLVFHRTRMVE
jgi:hypothetical protein